MKLNIFHSTSYSLIDQLHLFPSFSPEDKQKSIDIESACELLDLVLGFQFRPHVDKLVEYLKVDLSCCPVLLNSLSIYLILYLPAVGLISLMHICSAEPA